MALISSPRVVVGPFDRRPMQVVQRRVGAPTDSGYPPDHDLWMTYPDLVEERTPVMAGRARPAPVVSGSVAITVCSTSGAVDLIVPPGALMAEVAHEYAVQVGLARLPDLHTTRGVALAPRGTVADAGLVSGDVVIAGGWPMGQSAAWPSAVGAPGPPGLPPVWIAAAVLVAGAAGWCGTTARGGVQYAIFGVLVTAAVVGVVPVGRLRGHRRLAAPAFAAIATVVLVGTPHPEQLPVMIGIAGLCAAGTASLARALDDRADEALQVWLATGVLVFTVGSADALLRLGPQVAWAALLLIAVLAAQLAPTAWLPGEVLPGQLSGEPPGEPPGDAPGAQPVSSVAVAAAVAGAARRHTAGCVAVLVVATGSSALLLGTATEPVDRIGARAMVLAAAASLLLAARSRRQVGPHTLLGLAGLAVGTAGLVDVLPLLGPRFGVLLGVTLALTGAVLVAAGAAPGRRPRSARWARRAELADAVAGAVVIGVLPVAVGIFRALWELTFRV